MTHIAPETWHSYLGGSDTGTSATTGQLTDDIGIVRRYDSPCVKAGLS